jgi:type I restriction enzyme S subunit
MDGNFRCCEWQGGDAGLNQRVCKITPDSTVLHPKFLFYGLNGYLKAIEDATSSVTVGHLSSRDILQIPFPLPPLSEQHRIVAKLEALLAKVDACHKRLAKIPVILKHFHQSVLAAACSGRLTADWRENNPIVSTDEALDEPPAGWKSVCLGEVIENLKYGTAQKCDYKSRGVPVLRIPNVANGTIDHADLKYAELPPKELEQLRLHPGDILLIRSNGSVSLVGKCALAREADGGFAYAGYLIRLRPDAKKILPGFLNLALGSYDVRKQIEIPARSTSGVNNINSKEVRALRLFLPPLAEQQEIVRRVASLFALADEIETRYAKAQAQVDKLTPSLLAKAFRGELVPQDPNDEPASVLLERIRNKTTAQAT